MINYDNIIKEENIDLRKNCEEVQIPLSNEDLQTLNDMHEYLINGYDVEASKKLNIRPGVGLAAPQIDVLKKMFVIVAYDEKDELNEFGVINPKLISHSEELTYLEDGEGCLSVDRRVEGLVHRPKRIKVKFNYYDFDTNEMYPVTMRFKDYISIVFQHEYDHLSGKLFIDHINKQDPFFVPKNSTPVKFSNNQIDNQEEK